VHPRWGVPIVDHHYRVFSGKGHRVPLVEDLIDDHSSGEGPRGHEILHHTAIPEIVLDGVGVVWVSLPKELLEVVHGQSRLTLGTAHGSRGALHVRAACLLVDANVVAGHGCSLLKMLLVPLSCCPPRHPG
jgi:hypothetical protein